MSLKLIGAGDLKYYKGGQWHSATGTGGGEGAAAPTGFSVNPGDAVNSLTWTDPEDEGLTSIRVYRSETSGSGYELIATVDPGDEEYEDEDVENDTTYYYVLVAAYATPIVSAPTTEASGTPESAIQFVTLSVPASAVGSNLSDFPVYVNLALLPDEFWEGVQADGGDIRVTLDDGTTRLPLELVAFDKGEQVGTMFFLAPTVSTSGSDFRIYYGGSGSETQPAVDAQYGRDEVWDDYALVWHTAQDPSGSAPQITDSSGNGNHGTAGGTMSLLDDGPYGHALAVTRGGFVNKSSPSGMPSSPLTFQFATWFTALNESFNGTFGVGVSSAAGSDSQKRYQNIFYHTSEISRTEYGDGGGFFVSDDDGSAYNTAGVWYRWHFTHDGTNSRKYRNGSLWQTTSASGTATPGTRPVFMSANNGTNATSEGLSGRMAEMRIRSGALSADWIAAEHLNSTQPAFFLGVGEGQFNLYVATTGNDTTGNGTVGNPYATITKAASVAGPGYTINVAAGTYTGGFTTSTSGTSGSRLKYVSTTPHGAVIDGGGAQRVWTNSGNYVTIEGFELTDALHIGILNNGHSCRILKNYIHDLTATNDNGGNGGAFYTESDSTSHDNLVEGNICWGNMTPGSSSNNNHGIYIASAGGIVRNNIVGGCVGTGAGIHTWHNATQVTIANNLVYNCYHGIMLGSGSVSLDNSIVTNNIVMDINGTALFEIDSTPMGSNNVWINNIAYNVGGVSIMETGSPTGTITSNPLLVDYQDDGSGDYHLDDGSPAISAGTATGAPTHDYDGVARGSPPDIGPYEFVA